MEFDLVSKSAQMWIEEWFSDISYRKISKIYIANSVAWWSFA